MHAFTKQFDSIIEGAANGLAKFSLLQHPDSELQEIYAFVFAALLHSSITFGTMLVCAAALNLLGECTLWIVYFLAARHWSEGVHASSRLVCFLMSISVALGCLLMAQLLPASLLLTAVLNLLSVVLIFVATPASHQTNVEAKSRRKARRNARIEAVVAAFSVMAFSALEKAPAMAYAASLGTLSAAVSCLLKWVQLRYVNKSITSR